MFETFSIVANLSVVLSTPSKTVCMWMKLTEMKMFQALGFSMPRFAHVSLILAPDRSKLSKRHGATSVGQVMDLYATFGWNSVKVLVSPFTCMFFLKLILFSSKTWAFFLKQW